MRVLVCGDRNWTNEVIISKVLDEIKDDIDVVIDGHARGADQFAHAWAKRNGIDPACYPAQWQTYGPAAGPIRNALMLKEGKPDLVLAFHNDIQNSRGTLDMVRKAKKAGVPVRIIKERKP